MNASVEMFPTLASQHSSYHGATDAELGSDDLLRNSAADTLDLQHSYIGKFCRMAFTKRVTTFLDHVLRIIGWRTEKKMKRVAAGPVVAFVANVQAGRNRPKGCFPRDDVSIRLSLSSFSSANLAMAAGVAISEPFPAFIWTFLDNFGPKSFGNWFHIEGVA